MRRECPVCHKGAELSFQAKDWNRKVSGETFDYHRCPDCGLIFLSNVPDDLGAYYGNEYYREPSLKKIKKVAAKTGYQLDMVRRFVRGGHLLEIGSAFGTFAYQAKEAGFQVDVIEREKRCCEFLSNVVGVKAIESDAPHEAMGSKGHYDVIVLWQVIEHLPHPSSFRHHHPALYSRPIHRHCIKTGIPPPL